MARKKAAIATGSTGLLVLGMHRSGTSALARALQLGGADIGTRLVGASEGNETGHWEDALAVEIHERLLARLGWAWDQVLPLGGMALAEADPSSAQLIGDYLRDDRAAHPIWAIKDPRLCLFGRLWRKQADAAGIPLAAVIALRHPWEVAGSLAARDGLSAAKSMLLWLQYTVGALRVAEGLPTAVVAYADLLRDWRHALAPVQRLPGGERLHWDAAAQAALDRFISGDHRHHDVDAESAGLPGLIREVWKALAECARSGAPPEGLARRFSASLLEALELIDPLLADFKLTERQLWERIGRAESPVAAPPVEQIEATVVDVRDLVLKQHQDVVRFISEDVVRMQAQVSTAHEQVSVSEARVRAKETEAADLAREAERLRLQHAAALESAQEREVLAGQASALQAARVAELSAQIEQLLQGIEAATRQAAEHEARAQLVDRLHPAVDALAAEVSAVREGQARHEASLRAELDAARAQLGELQAEVARRETQLVALQRELAQGQEAMAMATRRHEEATQHAVRLHEQAMLLAASQHQAALLQVERARQEAAQLAAREHQAALLQVERARQEAAQLAAREHQDAMQLALRGHEEAAQQAEREREQASGAHAEAMAKAETQHRRELEQLRTRLQESAQELDRMRTENRVLRAASETLDRLMRSRSWRWTRPLRVMARAVRGHWSPEDSKAARLALRRLRLWGPRPDEAASTFSAALTVVPAPVSSGQLAEAQPGKSDVFVWAVIDWDFRFQRPQHLAKAMAGQGHRTFYISNNFVDSPTPGFRADPLDGSGRLFQVHLHLQGAPAIYFGLPSEAQVDVLRASLAELLAWTRTGASLSVVQHPYWSSLVRAVPNARMVYDCMDHHAGFENNASSILAAEHQLLLDADLVIVTSMWLQSEVGPAARACALVRNACEYEFFSKKPDECFVDPTGRKVIGYFGAIAEWFDIELVRKVAHAHPRALVLLVGGDTVGAREALEDVENIRFVGEVPYANLPYWLHGFDVALLPFKVIPLTLATNPVKLYEYLAAGKAVVAVDLPEMAQFGKLVRVAGDHAGFVAEVGAALAEPAGGALARKRREFAAGQTWEHRARAVDEAIEAITEPRVSVIVLTYNNLSFSQACLSSIEAHSDYGNLEVIVVDNASSDGSPEWLRGWEAEVSAAGHIRRLILNDDNLGFSAGNNVGLRAATGDYLVILNNDTYVTPGWVRTMVAHFRRQPRLGLLGPVTNNIGNEAKIQIEYADMSEMIATAAEYTRAHPGASIRMRNAAFFCVAMPRHVFEAVGEMDEAFGVGFFEDDDYCRRIDQAGYEVACADDVFVHHHLSASFDKLKAGMKQQLFDRNKAIYEAKWGPWIPHTYRKSEEGSPS